MIALLLILTWFSQGIPVPQAQTGTVTGILKTELGAPAAGVRVGAMIRPDSSGDLSSASALSSIAETDEAGRFRLENVPQGRYYITAGRVDFPTFFPGTQDVAAARVVLVRPGDVIAGIDFSMNSIATRPPDNYASSLLTPVIYTPIVVRVEGVGQTPVFSATGFATLRLTRTGSGVTTELPLSAISFVTEMPTAGIVPEYRIGVSNLPEGYSVKSMNYGSAVITNNTFRVAMTAVAAAINTLSQVALILGNGQPGTPTGVPLEITLSGPTPTSPPLAIGVRVTGRAPTAEVRSVYLSGVPGVFFADGSFEFRGVQPGRYSISTPDNPLSSRPLAATVVVGAQDVAGIELIATPMLPLNIKTPVPAEPVGNRTPGSTVPLSAVRGMVLDETTHEPIAAGTVYLTGHYGGSVSLQPDGRFEFTKLLPGSYQMEVQAFGHRSIRKVIVLGEVDIDLKLSAASSED